MLADVLRDALNGPSVPCVVGRWVTTQDEEVRELFSALMRADINVSALYRRISQEVDGLPFSLNALLRHFREDCVCPAN